MKRSVLIAVLVAGCAQVGVLPEGAPVPRDGGRALVFGRVRVVDASSTLVPAPRTVLEWLHWAGAPELKLHLFEVASGEKWLNVPYASDGRFEWLLPRGSYVLFRVAEGPPMSNEGLAAFEVPAGARAVCAGTLEFELEWEPSEDEGPPPYAIESVRIDADCEALWRELQSRHPADGATPEGAAAFTDEALRGLFDDYSRARAERIFAAHVAPRAER